jgi:hypothetical protein
MRTGVAPGGVEHNLRQETGAEEEKVQRLDQVKLRGVIRAVPHHDATVEGYKRREARRHQ